MPEIPELIDFYNIILLGYNEIALKSDKVRKRLLDTLSRNIKFQLYRENRHIINIRRDRGRVYIIPEKKTLYSIIDILKKVFGIYTISPAKEFGIEFDDIIKEIVEFASILLKKGNKFGLRVRKVGSHSFSSKDIAIEGGNQILDKFGEKLNLSVDLTHPDKWIYIEVRDKKSYIYTEKIPSIWSGNPIHLKQGGMVPILNCGDLSAYVSAFMGMKRGMYSLPILFIGDENSKEKNLQVVKEIFSEFKSYLPIQTFYIIQIDNELLKEVRNKFSEKFNSTIESNLLYQVTIMAFLQYIIKNQVKIFEQLENKYGIDLPSNLASAITKKKAKELNYSKQRELIQYNPIFWGNNLIFNSNIPIFHAAIGLNKQEQVDHFIRISKNFEKYFDFTSNKSEILSSIINIEEKNDNLYTNQDDLIMIIDEIFNFLESKEELNSIIDHLLLIKI
ncbi:MAG: hypothetical protein GY870_03550 [archaeon]|nr:hypothetical protein [archaeon]